jgi:hypothetical protein
VQLTVATVQVQPVPLIAVAVNPLGNVSVTVTAPLVATAVLPLLTVSVYVSTLSPALKFPVCVLVAVNCGPTISVADAAEPVPPFVDVIVLLVFTYLPATEDPVVKEIRQYPWGASVAVKEVLVV